MGAPSKWVGTRVRDLRECIESGMTDAQTAAELGETPLAIRNVRRRLNIPQCLPQTNRPKIARKIAGLKARGLSDLAIGKRLGIADRTVAKYRKKYQIAGMTLDARHQKTRRAFARKKLTARTGWPKDVGFTEAKVLTAMYDLSATADRSSAEEIAVQAGICREFSIDVLRRLVRRGHVISTGTKKFQLYQVKPVTAARYAGIVRGSSNSRPAPPTPCPHPPGTEGKIACLEQRQSGKVGLWHPRDFNPNVNVERLRFLEAFAEAG